MIGQDTAGQKSLSDEEIEALTQAAISPEILPLAFVFGHPEARPPHLTIEQAGVKVRVALPEVRHLIDALVEQSIELASTVAGREDVCQR